MSVLLLSFSDYALFLLRIAFGAVFLVHGWPKIRDLKQNAQNFDGMGFKPGALWGTIAALLEVIGGIALLVGLLTQVVALLIALEMVVATLWKKKNKQPFIGGYEFDVVLVAAGLVLATQGGGVWALDNVLGLFLLN